MVKIALLLGCATFLHAADRKMILVVGGDVQWSLDRKSPAISYDQAPANDPDWRPSPHVKAPPPSAHDRTSIFYDLRFGSTQEQMRYPLLKIAPLIQGADLAFVNLETPLSDSGRRIGEFRTPTAFADALRWAGIGVVSLANNHMFDASEEGLLDTMRTLWRAGIGYAGAGRNLAEARRPFIAERNGIRIAFLAYTQFVNMGETSFAQDDAPGLAPMDPAIIAEDIRAVRGQADLVAVSVHWGMDKTPNTSPANRELAHRIIDAGADIILGAHTPLPKGLETYKGKLIVYSPSHAIFGHNHPEWGDDYLLRLTLTPAGVTQAEVLPIAGKGKELQQPYPLHGNAARELLENVRKLTGKLDTRMEIAGDTGVVRVAPTAP